MREILRELEDLARFASSQYKWIASNAMREAKNAYRDIGPENPKYKAAVEEYERIVTNWRSTLESIGRIYAALASGNITYLSSSSSEEDMKKLYSLLEKLEEGMKEESQEESESPA